MVDLKLMFATGAAGWIGDTISDAFTGSALDSFISDDLGLGDIFKNDAINKAVKGVAQTAIEQGITPDYGKTPSQKGIDPRLSPIGSTGDFNPAAQGQNLLYRGTQGAIDQAMKKTGVQQFLIGHISANKVVNPLIKRKKTIGSPATSLKMANLKRGQITGAT